MDLHLYSPAEQRIPFNAQGRLITQLLQTHFDNLDRRPPHDDAQAMTLVKKFRLRIHWLLLSHGVVAEVATGDPEQREAIAVAQNADLSRAICECVAKVTKKGALDVQT